MYNQIDKDVAKCEERGRERMVKVLKWFYPWITYIFDFTKEQKNPVDFWSTATTNSKKQTYVGDVKAYLDEEHPRTLYGIPGKPDYPDYKINYQKLYNIKKRALNDKTGNRTPILVAVFPNQVAIWDLNKADWETSGTWDLVNKTGVDYGKEKVYEYVAHLQYKDALIKYYDYDQLGDC